VQRLDALVLQQADEHAHGRSPHLRKRLPHRRQRRRDDRGELEVVEADDRDVLGNPQPPRAGRLDHADREEVVEGEDGRRRIAQVEQLLARLHAACDLEVAFDLELDVRQDPGAGHQCGGWTLTWQGGSGATVPGTSILAGIREVAGPSTLVDFAPDGVGAEGHDLAIAVLGETSYVEFFGDRPAPDDLCLDMDDLAVVKRLAASGVPTVAVLVSGRPLVITDQLQHWQALVAAWLPGTEGAGVADVLFGAAAPAGTLPHSWPRSADQVPINVGDAEYDPLFPFGFGLAYRQAPPGPVGVGKLGRGVRRGRMTAR